MKDIYNLVKNRDLVYHYLKMNSIKDIFLMIRKKDMEEFLSKEE
jgi:uncharacterized protein YfkK (UPF0435 family)